MIFSDSCLPTSGPLCAVPRSLTLALTDRLGSILAPPDGQQSAKSSRSQEAAIDPKQTFDVVSYFSEEADSWLLTYLPNLDVLGAINKKQNNNEKFNQDHHTQSIINPLIYPVHLFPRGFSIFYRVVNGKREARQNQNKNLYQTIHVSHGSKGKLISAFWGISRSSTQIVGAFGLVGRLGRGL